MKTALCFIALILLINSGAFGHRDLRQLVTKASSYASVENGGSASASSSAKDGGTAHTESKAKNGANVAAKTVAEGKDGADVKATNVASGDGKGADVNSTLVVKDDKDIEVTRYVSRVVNGEKVETVAKELIVSFKNKTNDIIVKRFNEGLPQKEKHGALFRTALGLFVTERGCEASKTIFRGHYLGFLAYHLPSAFYQCIYPKCSAYPTAKSCCGDAQLKQKQCSCANGKCLYGQPAAQGAFLKYWKCQACGEQIPYCVCY